METTPDSQITNDSPPDLLHPDPTTGGIIIEDPAIIDISAEEIRMAMRFGCISLKEGSRDKPGFIAGGVFELEAVPMEIER